MALAAVLLGPACKPGGEEGSVNGGEGAPPAVQPAYRSVGEDVVTEPEPDQETAFQVSDTELRQFRIATRIMEEDALVWQEKMSQLTDKSGLTRARFQELQRVHREGLPVDATEAELLAYNQLNVGLEQLRSDMQRAMLVHIINAGLTRDRFRQINTALAQDSALQERYAEVGD